MIENVVLEVRVPFECVHMFRIGMRAGRHKQDRVTRQIDQKDSQ